MSYYDNDIQADFIFPESFGPVTENELDERWKQIDGHPDYYVSDSGRVWSSKRQKFLTPRKNDKKGHLGFSMDSKYPYLHRILAKAFIENPENEPVVRHLDDDVTNNELENLAWGTQKDNIHDCIRNRNNYILTPEDREKHLVNQRTPIKATNRSTGEIMIFESQCEAANSLKLQQSNIHKTLVGERNHTGGWAFEKIEKGGTNG